MNQQVLLVVNDPAGSPAQVIQHGGYGSTPHFKRVILVLQGEPALLVEVLNLIHVDKGVRIQNRCICKNLSGTVQRKASFQIPFHIPGNLVNKPILAIFQNCDLIFRFRMIVIDVILVGNKALVRNDFPDTFIGLLSPSPTGQLNGMVGVYVVMAAYFLYLGTDVRAVPTNVFRNGTGLPLGMASFLLFISVISPI